MSLNLLEKATKIMDERRGSCSQAIFATYGVEVSNGKVDFETCMKIASAFSGGIAATGNICGALNGALMAIGLKYGGDADPSKANAVSQKLLDHFKSLNGTVLCRELINHDLLTEEDVKHAFKTGAFDNCSKYVEDVAKFLDTLLNAE
jgi:C_GCAxxG_C_C family probable redox protein